MRAAGMPVSRPSISAVAPARATALVVAALLLLVPRLADGELCPLPDPSSDLSQYVSLCAMCSHNEAAVRWNRTQETSQLSYSAFRIRYECYNASGHVLIPEKKDRDEKDDCQWTGTIYPIGGDYLHFGIASVGQELSNGTGCSFTLSYRVKVGIEREKGHIKLSSCTVGGGCEGEECSIDRVCTFSNGTQGVEEGLCTECSCSEGYSGPACANINECAGRNACDDNADCVDSDGSYWCQCLPGFQGDGYNCTDINECENETCGENAECLNTEGSYSCGCKSGFTGDGYNCTDFDECSAESLCPIGSQCNNSFGSYLCECEPGLATDGDTCKDIDECEIGDCICSENAVCINIYRGYECHCAPGFTGDGQNCTDIDECSSDGDICANDTHTVCKNFVGQYTCECQEGYYRDINGTCREGPNTALIVTTAVSALVLTLIVVLLLILLCLRILRPKTVTYDDLTIKEIDPYYSPKYLGLSVESIHSEYECLHQLKSAPSIENIEQLLENGNDMEEEAHPVINEIGTSSDPSSHTNDSVREEPQDKNKTGTTFDPSQEKIESKTEKVSDSVREELQDKDETGTSFDSSQEKIDLRTEEVSAQEPLGEESSGKCVSGKKDSISPPKADEQSLSNQDGTNKVPQAHNDDLSNAFESSLLGAVGPSERDINDLNSRENSPSTSATSNPSYPSGQVVDDELQPSVSFHPSDTKGSKEEKREVEKAGEQENVETDPKCNGISSGAENGAESLLKCEGKYVNYDPANDYYSFRVGDNNNMAKCTDEDTVMHL